MIHHDALEFPDGQVVLDEHRKAFAPTLWTVDSAMPSSLAVCRLIFSAAYEGD